MQVERGGSCCGTRGPPLPHLPSNPDPKRAAPLSLTCRPKPGIHGAHVRARVEGDADVAREAGDLLKQPVLSEVGDARGVDQAHAGRGGTFSLCRLPSPRRP